MRIQILVVLTFCALAFAHPGKDAEKGGKGSSHSGGNDQGKTGARGGPPMTLPAGCENYDNATAGVNASACCPSLPKAFHHDMFNRSKHVHHGHENGKSKNGKSEHGKSENGHHENGGHHENICKKVDQITTFFNLTTTAGGVIDATAAVNYLVQATGGSTTYDFNTIVNTCISNAPSDVAAAEAMWKNASQAHHGPGGRDPSQCPTNTKLNMAIIKCVRRQLILQCPNWVQSTECSNLMTFAKNCPVYPMMCHKHRDGQNGKDQSNESQGKNSSNGKGVHKGKQ